MHYAPYMLLIVAVTNVFIKAACVVFSCCLKMRNPITLFFTSGKKVIGLFLI